MRNFALLLVLGQVAFEGWLFLDARLSPGLEQNSKTKDDE